MRGVLKWLLGPTFDFMPDEIVQLFIASKADIWHGVTFVDNKAPAKRLAIASNSLGKLFQQTQGDDRIHLFIVKGLIAGDEKPGVRGPAGVSGGALRWTVPSGATLRMSSFVVVELNVIVCTPSMYQVTEPPTGM